MRRSFEFPRRGVVKVITIVSYSVRPPYIGLTYLVDIAPFPWRFGCDSPLLSLPATSVIYAAHSADTKSVFRGAMSADAQPGARGGRAEGRIITPMKHFFKDWAEGRGKRRQKKHAHDNNEGLGGEGYIPLAFDGKVHQCPSFLFFLYRQRVPTSRFLVHISVVIGSH